MLSPDFDRTKLASAKEIGASLLAALRPDPATPIADWVLAHRTLSSAVTALPGPMDIGHTPYMREIYEAAHPRSGVEEIVVKKASQVAYSDFVLSVIGYYVVQSPCPMMLIAPSDDDIKLFTQQRLRDLRDGTPAFERVIESASAGAADNLHNIGFRGGFLRIVPARSASRLSAMPVRVLIADEVDQYPADVKGQGSPLELAARRQDTFGRRKKRIMGGTPTVDGASAIDAEYKRGDCRQYHVPCPFCGGFQSLEFARLKWPKDQPLLAQYECAHCRKLIDERHKTAMLQAGVWIPTRQSSRRSYWITGMMRPIGSLGWGGMVEQWLAIGNDTARLKAFQNLVIGETYKEEGILELRSGDLAQRAEVYLAQVPSGVRVITAGVDVQASPPRFEVEIVGWGDGFESWSLGYHVIAGGIKSPQARQLLLSLLSAPMLTADGKTARISYTCIDSGNETTDTYAFCRPYAHAGIMAVKGMSSDKKPIWPLKPTKIAKHNILLRIVGVDQAKADIYRFAAVTEPGPGYMHTPADREQSWYDGLLSEIRDVKVVGGRVFPFWRLPTGRHNEPLDCRVYAYAAAVGAVREAGLDLSRYNPVKPLDGVATTLQSAPKTAPAAQVPVSVQKSAPKLAPKPMQKAPAGWGGGRKWGARW